MITEEARLRQRHRHYSLISRRKRSPEYYTSSPLDILLRKLFNEKGITFPSMMAGCVAMFSIMVLAEVLRAGSGEAVFEFLSPGAGLLARWMSVFFVPGVAMLPTAPKLGSNLEAVKVLSIIVVGFFFSLLTTGFSVLGLRTMLGQVVTPSDVSTIKTKEDAATSAAAPAKPYSEEVLRYLVSGALVLFPVSIIAKKIEHPLYTPIQTLFMLCTSVGAYVYGARLPRSVTKIIHPLIVATTAILSSTYLTGCFTGRSFIDVLRTYKAGSLSSDKGGAGDFLLFMLGPAVCSLSIAMYSRKTLMKENFLVVLVAVLVSAVGGLFGTAGYVRLINLNGSVVRRSVLSRNVTTALAMAITKILEGNTSIAACVVVIVGIIGATYAARIMTFVGIHDPVARGLAMGSAAQGLGAASMISEKDAFPFAAINMILTAVAASTLASIPTIRTVLLDFALGKLKGETV
eukprot:CAMPEP_0172498324 /NCGR_PEP_ID=MMETSP1066-20121228/112183_1 /TAXON_ID=671091 /ORGANISM="Coscinodiscus wailesii, Strain CCMP2513" /LENGTH=459 /DNA_ID=CAMNT_0013271555 /DNA_START=275 /DNA_END=1653 /DNA_ORIENTATION=+